MTATRIDGTARTVYKPSLKYYDEKTDAAVLKIEGKNLAFLTVSTRPIRVGDDRHEGLAQR